MLGCGSDALGKQLILSKHLQANPQLTALAKFLPEDMAK